MRLVDLSKYGFLVEPRYFFFGWTNEPRVLGRESAVKALQRAQKLLPKGYRFKVWDMQRPRTVQLKMRESFRRRLKQLHPRASAKRIEELVDIFGAPALPDHKVVRTDVHRKGGAVDLTIVDKHGVELYMGTDHDDLTQRAATDFFKTLKRSSAMDLVANKNRALLVRVMTRAGWKGYDKEWWHWSTTE